MDFGMLVTWYRSHARTLPWRESLDPYRVWLSEIMLQQTRVDTVIPYFHRFLEAFPTVEALAQADPDRVLKLWEGLGYYSRARNLMAAARMVTEEFGGRFPSDPEVMQRLPGVGRSTANSIVSICFGIHAPVLDGNVKRVLARLHNFRSNVDDTAGTKALWALAEQAIADSESPGDHNQAMMDLGATVCTPAGPVCLICPMAAQCLGRRAGKVDELPVRKQKAPIPHFHVAVGVLEVDGRVLVQKRPDQGMLGGLWEFPGGKVEDGEAVVAAVAREFMEEVGLAVNVGQEVAVVKHAYSHFRITLHAFRVQVAGASPLPAEAPDRRWVALSELGALAFPTANRRVLEALLSGS